MTIPVNTMTPGMLLNLQERERVIAAVLRKAGFASLEGAKVFEAGCGTGYSLRQVIQWGAHPDDVAGIEIDAERAEYARRQSPGVRIHNGTAEDIPEPDRVFDVCMAFRLFSSLHNETAADRIANEIFRITRPGGLIIVYDIRRKKARYRSIQAVDADDVKRWFPKCRAKTQHLTLAATPTAIVGRVAPFAYGALSMAPPMRTHSLHVMRRPATSPFEGDEWTPTVVQASGEHKAAGDQ